MNFSKSIPFKKIKSTLFNQSFLTYAVFFVVLVTTTQGYCDSTAKSGIDSIATEFKNLIFNYWIRIIMMCASAFTGIAKALAANSPVPLFSWFFLAFILGYLPRIIDYLATVGL